MAYRFPDIGVPVCPFATNSGNTYTKVISDSTIKSETDGGYKITRPRNSRTISSWTFVWTHLTEEEYTRLEEFYKQVTTAMQFQWNNPLDEKEYTVRFSGQFSFVYDFPYGYRGSLTFEEV